MDNIKSIDDITPENFAEFLAAALTKAKDAGKVDEALKVMKSAASGMDSETSDNLGIFTLWHLDGKFKADVTRVVARELGH